MVRVPPLCKCLVYNQWLRLHYSAPDSLGRKFSSRLMCAAWWPIWKRDKTFTDVCDELIGFVRLPHTNDSFVRVAFDSLMMTRQGQNSEPTYLSLSQPKRTTIFNQWSMGHWAFLSFAKSLTMARVVFLFMFSFSIFFFSHSTTTDDPYYCGLRARVSNFVKNKNTKEPVKESGTEIKMKMTPHVGTYQAALSHGHPMQAHQMWHSRSFDSGMGNCFWHLPHNLHTFSTTNPPPFIFFCCSVTRFTTLCRTESRRLFFFPFPQKPSSDTKLSLFPFGWHPPKASSFPSTRLLLKRRNEQKW